MDKVLKFYASKITGRVHSVMAPVDWEELGDTPLRATEDEAKGDLA